MQKSLPKTPVIFASTHSFREDIESATILTDKQAFILIGSLSQIFKTLDGLTAWITGLILVNRMDKKSRKAAKDKMKLALEYGSSVLIFPEGTWNKSPNNLIGGLFPGVYDVAKETGALVVPIATIREEKQVYGIREKAFDITQYNRKEGMIVLRDKLATMRWELMELLPQAKRSDYPTGTKFDEYWKNHIDSLMAEVKYYDYEEELHTKFIDKSITKPSAAFSFFDRLIPCKENVFLLGDRR